VKVDVRIIAATNADLSKLMRDGQFREDLFYRLNVITMQLPPLRRKREDIPLLIAHFLEKYSEENKRKMPQVTPEAMRVLMDHSWPGNVRELENAIERACIISDSLILQPGDLGLIPSRENETLEHLDLSGTLSEVAHRALHLVERKKILAALEANQGNKSRTAEDLGVSYKTLLNKIKDYDLL